MPLSHLAKPLFVVVLAASLAGCGAVDLLLPNQMSPRTQAGVETHQGPTTEADKIKVEPITSNDLDCPSIDIAEGGASLRVGGPDNNAVRYQVNIADVSRNCEPRGNEVAIHIGVRGLALVGPAGAAGKFSADLKVLVQSIDKKTLYQKAYKIDVDTAGGQNGSYALVLDPIVLPLTRTNLDDLYNVTIGLGNSVSTKPVKTAKRTH